MTKKAQSNTKAEASKTSADPAASQAAAPAANTGNENQGNAVNAEADPADNDSKDKKSKDETPEDLGKRLREKLQPYFKAHPTIDVFYVTSDGQPFFEAQWAREHQKTVDPKEKVSIVNR